MLPSHLCRLILFALVSFISIASQAADKRGITEKDLFDFVWIGDPQISPDGSRVAFVRVSVNEKRSVMTPPSGRSRLRQGTAASADQWPA
jgi:hypothetical protein